MSPAGNAFKIRGRLQVSNAPHVSIEGLSVVYETSRERLAALDNLSLAVGRGEFVSIIGPSGCGKSTLLRTAGGLQAPTSGRVLIDGRPPAAAQREKSIGFVFQDASLLPWRSVIENVRLPLQVNRPRRPAAEASPGRLVDLVGLSGFSGYYPHQLSGGMQQRVALARALVTAPSLLLMDEPFGALDEMTRAAMRFELLHVWRTAARERGCTVLFVTHSITEAVLLSDRIAVLTPRPGRLAGVIDVHLERPRSEEIEFDPRFIAYVRSLRSLLAQPSAA